MASLRGVENRMWNTTLLGGSLHYMPPERLTGHYSQASDVYSFGVMILEMLSGKRLADLGAMVADSAFPDAFEAARWAGCHPENLRRMVENLRRSYAGEPQRRPKDVAAWAESVAELQTALNIELFGHPAQPEFIVGAHPPEFAALMPADLFDGEAFHGPSQTVSAAAGSISRSRSSTILTLMRNSASAPAGFEWSGMRRSARVEFSSAPAGSARCRSGPAASPAPRCGKNALPPEFSDPHRAISEIAHSPGRWVEAMAAALFAQKHQSDGPQPLERHPVERVLGETVTQQGILEQIRKTIAVAAHGYLYHSAARPQRAASAVPATLQKLTALSPCRSTRLRRNAPYLP